MRYSEQTAVSEALRQLKKSIILEEKRAASYPTLYVQSNKLPTELPAGRIKSHIGNTMYM